MRLFVSIDLDGLAAAVAAVQEPLASVSGLDLVDPNQTHVTLKFLGEVGEKSVPEIETAVSEAVRTTAIRPFTATFEGLGAFPNSDYIRVVWLGVSDGASELTRLYEAIERRLIEEGFEPESHEFTPHVTLGRMRHGGGKEKLQRALETEGVTAGSMEVREVRLKESLLSGDAPEYVTVSRFELI
ncbi:MULTISPECIES: RNA 2',3'-cyclic phosphodiesterase [unclassified Haladaptatus]|uniref:RNA 2',3'-cyclic phosphodiesterase n=1 Tax=unclassified Haladaptatus TaxID=2622732 RepID=UPI0023E88C5D|nr:MULTISPECIES: RNA 2',3'-cyclic phosphodiesterase [unclassified Haladaptatus]